MKKNNRKGFTIVELVIVIAVIAILAGVLIPTFAGIVEKANQSARAQEAAAALKAVLVVEDGAFDTDEYTYTFVIKDGDDVYKYEYANGALGEEKELTTATAITLTANDVVYDKDTTFAAVDDKVVAGEGVTVKVVQVSDLGDVIVLKVAK